ncbi:MAG: hypothetical protein LBK42_01735 [Propionibacteriaceae bacterium]|nr:hypothetical protein [Propionibacteriaceae bacterium]
MEAVDAVPVLARVARDGVGQGVFDTPCPQEATEMILSDGLGQPNGRHEGD